MSALCLCLDIIGRFNWLQLQLKVHEYFNFNACVLNVRRFQPGEGHICEIFVNLHLKPSEAANYIQTQT